MTEKHLIILTKIILFYSIFYIGIRIVSIFQGAWLIPNILLSIPFLFLFLGGIYVLRSNRPSWIFPLAGILVIVLVRIFEARLATALQQLFE